MKLNAAARKRIPKSEFGLPGKRKYPMPDRGRLQMRRRALRRW